MERPGFLVGMPSAELLIDCFSLDTPGLAGLIAGTTQTPRKHEVLAGLEIPFDAALALAFLSDAVDKADCIQQRCCLVKGLLDIERNLDRLVGKTAPAQASAARAIPAALSRRVRTSVKYVRTVSSAASRSIVLGSFAATSNAPCAAEVERKGSNLVASFRRSLSLGDQTSLTSFFRIADRIDRDFAANCYEFHDVDTPFACLILGDKRLGLAELFCQLLLG